MGSINFEPAARHTLTPEDDQPAGSPAFVLVTIGGVAGLFSGVFGVGGGIILVPLLMWWAGMDFLRASATSLGVILPVAAVGTLPYLVFGQFSWWITISVAIGSAAGAHLGMRVRGRLPTTALELSFAVFLLGISILLVFVGGTRDTLLAPEFAGVAILVAIGVAGGIAASVFGAGGGVFLVPLLIVAGVGDLVAKSVSLLALIPASLIPSVTHLRRRTTSVRQLAPVALSGIACAPIGALWAQYLSTPVSSVTISVLATAFAGAAIVRVISRLRRK